MNHFADTLKYIAYHEDQCIGRTAILKDDETNVELAIENVSLEGLKLGVFEPNALELITEILSKSNPNDYEDDVIGFKDLVNNEGWSVYNGGDLKNGASVVINTGRWVFNIYLVGDSTAGLTHLIKTLDGAHEKSCTLGLKAGLGGSEEWIGFIGPTDFEVKDSWKKLSREEWVAGLKEAKVNDEIILGFLTVTESYGTCGFYFRNGHWIATNPTVTTVFGTKEATIGRAARKVLQ